MYRQLLSFTSLVFERIEPKKENFSQLRATKAGRGTKEAWNVLIVRRVKSR